MYWGYNLDLINVRIKADVKNLEIGMIQQHDGFQFEFFFFILQKFNFSLNINKVTQ